MRWRRPSASLAREEAVAELVRRYFISHGPATVQDFVWWSGLTTADTTLACIWCKADLVKEVIGGKTYWLAPSTRSEAASASTTSVSAAVLR